VRPSMDLVATVAGGSRTLQLVSFDLVDAEVPTDKILFLFSIRSQLLLLESSSLYRPPPPNPELKRSS
jgi:hypothetical protein